MTAHALLDDRGQGLGEYAVILALVAALCVAAVIFLGSQIVGQYHEINEVYP